MYINGTPYNDKYLLTGACCKHFVAYDVESIPVDRFHFDAKVDVRNMWEHYMPAFDACINEAKAMHVMVLIEGILRIWGIEWCLVLILHLVPCTILTGLYSWKSEVLIQLAQWRAYGMIHLCRHAVPILSNSHFILH